MLPGATEKLTRLSMILSSRFVLLLSPISVVSKVSKWNIASPLRELACHLDLPAGRGDIPAFTAAN